MLRILTCPPLGLFVFFPIFFLSVLSASAGGESDSIKQIIASAKQIDRARIFNDFAAKILENKPEQAILHATEALQHARKIKNLREEARALFILAEASYYLDNLKVATGFYLESANIEKKLGGTESEGYINRIGDVGYCYYITDHHLEALKYLQESLVLSIKGGFKSQAASMYSNIGSIYTEWGDYNLGLENNIKALEIDRAIGDPVQISTDLNNIGKIYEQWGKYDEAVIYYKESLDIARSVGNQSMIAIRLNNLGIVYKAWEKYSEALNYFLQTLEIEHSQGKMEKVGRRLSYIAATYLSMEQYDKCLSYLNQASPIVKKEGLGDDLSRLYNTFGRYYLSTGDYVKAVEYFHFSQDYAIKNNLKPMQIGNLQSLAEAYEKSGNPFLALKIMKQFIVLKDSVFTTESDARLTEFQARFESEKMRLDNEMLKKDAELKWNVYLMSGIAAFTLVVILLSIILILRLKARNTKQARFMAEQQSKRLEMELELRNKELTCNAMSIIKRNETVAEMMETLEIAIRNGEPADIVNAVFAKIRNGDRATSWKEFELRFTQVHKDFYEKLNECYPNLSPNERKLCAFLRLNMTTKDIASITHQSVHSINVARTRLRKKINLANSDENLVNFLFNL
ncbi:MAG: tetratricopeptide repeat protein [Bacteroidales bacterium]|nr:tetratricopeptide repeat protein [Bacteroidales bacterium]